MDHDPRDRTITTLVAIVQTMMPELYCDAPDNTRRPFDDALGADDPLALAIAAALTPEEIDHAFAWGGAPRRSPDEELAVLPVAARLDGAMRGWRRPARSSPPFPSRGAPAHGTSSRRCASASRPRTATSGTEPADGAGRRAKRPLRCRGGMRKTLPVHPLRAHPPLPPHRATRAPAHTTCDPREDSHDDRPASRPPS